MEAILIILWIFFLGFLFRRAKKFGRKAGEKIGQKIVKKINGE